MAAGDVTTQILTPKAFLGAKFDGVDDDIHMSTYGFLGTGSFSISLWVKVNDAQSGVLGTIITNRAGTLATDAGFSIRTKSADDGIDFEIADGVASEKNCGSDTSIIDGEWHNIICVRDYGNRIYCYIDGILNGSPAESVGDISVVSDIFIGIQTDDDGPCDMIIRDVKIFNRDLSSEEAASIYAQKFSGSDFTEGLVGHWPLTSDYTDAVGSNDGTNNGSIIGNWEYTIKDAVASAYVSANDKYLLTSSANGLQVIFTHIEEAP
jgi:hypothetical protein